MSFYGVILVLVTAFSLQIQGEHILPRNEECIPELNCLKGDLIDPFIADCCYTGWRTCDAKNDGWWDRTVDEEVHYGCQPCSGKHAFVCGSHGTNSRCVCDDTATFSFDFSNCRCQYWPHGNPHDIPAPNIGPATVITTPANTITTVLPTNSTITTPASKISTTVLPTNSTITTPASNISTTVLPTNSSITTPASNLSTTVLPTNSSITTPVSNISTTVLPTNSSITTPASNITNSTTTEEPTNSTSTEEPTNSTSTDEPTNSTTTEFPINSTTESPMHTTTQPSHITTEPSIRRVKVAEIVVPVVLGIIFLIIIAVIIMLVIVKKPCSSTYTPL